MRPNPFLARFAVRQQQHPVSHATYDPAVMLLTVDGMPAVFDATYQDRGATLVTKVERETTDDN